jgi:transposase
MKEANLPISVVAPSKTPRQSAPDSKTDSLDARKLAQYAAKGLLRHIAIPTKHQEAQRQIIRLRQQLVAKQTRVKLQIKGFLLQHGINQPAGLSRWSIAAVDHLKNIQLSAPLRFCLDTLLQELRFVAEQLKLTAEKIEDAYKTFCRLTHNTGSKNKAITAMARKLAIHLWMMARENKPYNSAA